MRTRALALMPALWVVVSGLWIGPRYDRFVLPAFDGFIYDAMADNPGIFTVAPWGYRILAPWIVHFLPAPSAAVGFFWLNLILLSSTVFLLGSWLRRLGFSATASALGCLTLALTPPMRAVLDYQVLVDPLALFITVLILYSFAAPHAPTLAALFALGALTKEMCLLPLAVVPFLMAERAGWRRAGRASAMIAAPAIGLTVLLRMSWGEESAHRSPALLASLSERAASIPLLYVAMFGAGTLLLLIGFLREPSVALRATGVLLWFGNFLAVLANPYGFATADLLRLWPFAWAPALPLALLAVGMPRSEPPQLEVHPGRWRTVAAGAAVLGALGLAMNTDPYRRVPASDAANPVILLARYRESLKTARALDEGETFSFDAESGRFSGPVAQTFNLTEGRRQRWFLLDGFGLEAAFQSGVPIFEGKAELIIPILTPRDVTLFLELRGPQGARVLVGAAGRELSSVQANGARARVRIPATALFRGDNVLALRTVNGAPVGLVRFEISLDPATPHYP